MADSLASRVTRILAGSAHAFLDVVEDMAPEAMMRQAVREIDQVMGEVRGGSRQGRGGEAPHHEPDQQAQYRERAALRAHRNRAHPR